MHAVTLTNGLLSARDFYPVSVQVLEESVVDGVGEMADFDGAAAYKITIIIGGRKGLIMKP